MSEATLQGLLDYLYSSAEGKVFDFDDVMREIEDEFAHEEKLEMAKAV